VSQSVLQPVLQFALQLVQLVFAVALASARSAASA
jgi:hypothetical protein